MKFEPKKLIGHTACPECVNKNAEVKTDKSGNLYRWCTDVTCNAQYFIRSADPVKTERLLSKTRLLAAPAADPAPAPAPAADPVPEKSAPKKPGAFATLLTMASKP